MLLANIQVLQKLIKIDTFINLCYLSQEKANFYKNKEPHNFDD